MRACGWVGGFGGWACGEWGTYADAGKEEDHDDDCSRGGGLLRGRGSRRGGRLLRDQDNDHARVCLIRLPMLVDIINKSGICYETCKKR